MNSVRIVKFISVLVVFLVAGLVVFAGFQLRKLNTEYSVREFFPKNHPVLANDDRTAKTFQLAERPLFLTSISLKPTQVGNWLNPERIHELEEVTEQLAQIKGVKEVKSLTNLELALDDGKTLQIGPLFKTLAPAEWAAYVGSQALLKAQFISEDFRSVLITVEPGIQDSKELLRIDHEIRTLAEHGQGWEVNVGGVPAVQSSLADRLGKEILKFLGLSLILFCLMFFFFYRNLQPLMFAVVGLVVVNLTAIGWLSYFGIAFTVLLSTLPIIVSIAFVSIAVHTFHLWAERRKHLAEKSSGLLRFQTSIGVLRELAMPNFLGSLTTAIGFMTLGTANIPAIRTYAFVTAAAVVWTWFITQILLVGFQHLFMPVARNWNHARAWWMLSINRWSLPVLAATFTICVVLGGTVQRLNFAGRLFDDLPRSELVSQSTEKLDQRFGGTVALDVTLKSAREDAWKDPVLLQKLAGALSQVRAIDGIGSALGLTDFMGQKLPATREAVSEFFFLFSMSPENPLTHFVNSDFSQIRVSTRLKDLPSDQVLRIRNEMRGILGTLDPQMEVFESGLAVNSHTLNQEIAKELVYGFWQSLLLIGLLLVIIFRSFRWALAACLPNFVPPAVLIGTLVLFQTPVKPGIALIFSIALGLAFNNTVYLLSRLKRIQSEKKMNTLPLRRALLEEGNPCFSESFIMFVGFLIFLSSDFRLNQTFGAYMILSIFAGALADLVFLPAILRECSSVLWSKTTASAAWFSLPMRHRTSRPMMAGVAGFAVVVLVAILLFGKEAPAATDEAKTILEKARTQLDSKNDQATVQLKIIEPNGEVKIREMSLQTMRDADGFKALVRIQAPADIKGTALLAEVEKGEERQWLYLPSSKQVRRVASAKKSTGVLGSELSPEDLNADSLKGASAKLVKKDATSAVVEVTPTKGASEYTKVLTTFSMPQALPQRTEYYIGTKLTKTVEFQDYKAIDGKIYRAQTIRVKNVEKNRGTDIVLSNLKVNTNLAAKNFSQDALKDTF